MKFVFGFNNVGTKAGTNNVGTKVGRFLVGTVEADVDVEVGVVDNNLTAVVCSFCVLVLVISIGNVGLDSDEKSSVDAVAISESMDSPKYDNSGNEHLFIILTLNIFSYFRNNAF